MTGRHRHREYLPAAGHHGGLFLYDPIARFMGMDRVQARLLAQAATGPGARVLDVGCGTGTLIATLARRDPSLDIAGVDPDPNALARAARKLQGVGATVALHRGFADALPYADASFERVFSSFALHHVPAEGRHAALGEMRRVLKPGGSLHLVDFVPPSEDAGRLARWLHGGDHFKGNEEERVLALLARAGFAEPRVVERGSARPWLRLAYYRAPVATA